MPIVGNLQTGNRLGGAMMLLFGVVATAISLQNIGDTRMLVAHGRRMPGIVVALNAGASHPEVEFADQAGRTYRFPGNGFVSHRVGDHVSVLFSEDDPSTSAVLDEPGALWAMDAATCAVGLAVCLAGLYSMIAMKARGARS